MKGRVALAVVAVAVAAGVIGGWWQLRRSAIGRAAAAAAEAEALARIHPDTLRSGETLDRLLRRGGLDGAAVAQVLSATAPVLDPRRLRPGLPVEFDRDNDSTPATAITFKLAVDRILHVTRADSVHWETAVDTLPWATDTVLVRGAVDANLYDALGGSAVDLFPGDAHEALVLEVADVYKYRVDMTRDLRTGDSLYALVERRRGPESTTRVTHVLASRLFVGGKPIEAFYYRVPSSSSAYYDDDGKSLSTAFLHSPIDFARVTSSFGMRFHPILKIRRPHRGVDYGAVSGTPVRVIGDGTVTRVGSDPGGFGNVVEVRHPNGFVTRYAHLRGFNRQVARYGARVKQGEVIGYVGMTGLATAPHLHFEILVRGSQTNPAAALRNVAGVPLPKAAFPAFNGLRRELLGLLKGTEGIVHATVATAAAATPCKRPSPGAARVTC
ncbi:MAG: M23 family metallopeptidase [Gemmatimonadota bacterium]|nr:M23 family metallopeptidase [Gemmatimonadota bacterium]